MGRAAGLVCGWLRGAGRRTSQVATRLGWARPLCCLLGRATAACASEVLGLFSSGFILEF
jgi:hypothetical protein